LRTIEVGARPYTLCLDPQQNRVYVANFAGSSISVLRDSASGIEETRNAEVRTSDVATVVRGVLFLPPASSVERLASSVLLDISGRQVMALRPGANDVSRLSPGVYFVREKPQASSRKPQAMRKMVLTE